MVCMQIAFTAYFNPIKDMLTYFYCPGSVICKDADVDICNALHDSRAAV